MTISYFAKHWLIVLCAALIIPLTVHAQSKVKVDSLKKVIASTTPLSKQHVDALNTLGYAYARTDTATAFKYVAEAKTLAQKMQYLTGLGEAYDATGNIYSNKNLLDAALKNYNIAIDYFNRVKDKNRIGNVYSHMGNAYKYTGNLKEALAISKKAEQLHRETNDQGQLASDLNNQSAIYVDMGNNAAAIKSYIEAGKLFAQVNRPVEEGQLMINLGNLLRVERNYKDALKYFETALDVFQKRNDPVNLGLCLLGFSNVYADQSDYNNSIKYLSKASEAFQKAGFARGVASCYNNIGAIYIRTGKYREAIPYLEKSIAASEAGKAFVGIPLTQQNIAYAYTQLGEYKLASEWFDKAENGVKLYKADMFTVMEIYNHRSSLDSAMGNYQNAFVLRNKYLVLKDSLLNEKLSKQVNELQLKYQTEKKDNQINLLNKEKSINMLQLNNQNLTIEQKQLEIARQGQALLINELRIKNQQQQMTNQLLDNRQKAQNITTLKKQSRIQQLELANRALQLKQKNILIAVSCFLLVVVIIVAYSFYNRYKIKQEARLLAAVHKQQEVATRALFEGEQTERIRIARDLHDSIGQMLSVIKMNVSNLQHQFPDNRVTETTLGLVDDTIGEVRNISHNLIPEELNFGLFTAIEDMCEKINAAEATQVAVNIPDQALEHQFEKSNELSIYRIVQEVLGNMVKHAQATQINLDVLQQGQNLLLSIKDNGKGFDTSQIDKSKGIGWKNIAARVNMLDGKMQIRSEKLTGTQIEITIPGT